MQAVINILVTMPFPELLKWFKPWQLLLYLTGEQVILSFYMDKQNYGSTS